MFNRKILFSFEAIALIVGAVAYFLLVRYFDTRWRFMPYTFAFTFAFSAVVFLITKRVVFSLYTSGTIVILLAIVSAVKFRLKGLALHLFDFVFTGTDTATVKFLLVNYTSIGVLALLAIAVALAGLTFLYRRERPLPFRWSAGAPAFAVAFATAYAAHPSHDPKEADFLPYVAGYNASAFPLSFANVPDMVGWIPLASKIDEIEGSVAMANTADCGPGRNRPDFMMILSESQSSPLVFPELAFPKAVTDSYRSDDGTIKPLYVETVGGGTWMTNFTVLTSLSSADFGWQAAYVTRVLDGRIKGALPEVLAQCGYRTITVMPMPTIAFNEGPFLKSIGFQEVFGAETTGHEPMSVRDKVYFDYVDALIEKHRKEDGRPLFIAIQTMFTHAPYETVLLPEPKEPASHYNKAADLNEYMRRIALARQDLQAFLDKREAVPGPRGTLVMEFGDHQSVATRDMMLLNSPDNLLTDLRSKIYETYYAVHAYKTPVDFSDLDQPEDATFLIPRLIAAAKLPTSPKYRDLVALSEHCNGRFHTCEDRLSVDRHLKGLVAGGLLRIE